MPSQQYENLVSMFTRSQQGQAGPMNVLQMREGAEVVARLLPLPDWASSEVIDAGGVGCEWVRAPEASDSRAIVYFHGGGYVLWSVKTHASLAAHLSRAARAPVLLVDYRLAPEHPHPAAVEDAQTAYRWLLDRGTDPAGIAVAGDSAGGGLTMALLVAARDAGLALPGAAGVISPWVDLECTGESVATRAGVDPIITTDFLKQAADAYLAGADPRSPLVSPLYADLAGLPPTLVQVGDREVLLDDARRLADVARAAGVDITLDVWPDMIHVWQMFAGAGIPESQQALEQLGAYFDERLIA